MRKHIFIICIIGVVLFGLYFVLCFKNDDQKGSSQSNGHVDVNDEQSTVLDDINDAPQISHNAHPMMITSLRNGSYSGGNFEIERKLPNGSNYQQFVASYRSEGLKIYGLLTVPLVPKPENGFPAIIFVHGYILPAQYSTTGSYPTYQATLARAGFVTFKPDLRGHGNSEGEPVSAHFSEKYVIDTLNAISYLKQYEDVDPQRIGYWGHSNGGEIGLRIAAMNSSDIKAYALWAGVVGSFEDMLETYNDKIPFLKDADDPLIMENGLPSENPAFWRTIDPYTYLDDITAPIQLQHGTNDDSAPIELSDHLYNELTQKNKIVEIYRYNGDDHNISANTSIAFRRAITFFEENLK